MNGPEFAAIRHRLGKSQSQTARLLCLSSKAIQSFEQGWRAIPPSAQRQILFLLFLKAPPDDSTRPCWEIRGCPEGWRTKCAAWELRSVHLCWFINGTFCEGKFQDSGTAKLEACRECDVFKNLIDLSAQPR